MMYKNRKESSALSEFWRVNTSTVEAIELANLLRALRKVAGFLGKNAPNIVWYGMSANPAVDVILPPPTFKKYPVPPDFVDILVGIVVKESLQRIEWSDYIWKKIEETAKLTTRQKEIVYKLFKTGEHIYLDTLANKTILGKYVEKARKIAIKTTKRNLTRQPVTVDKLFYLWWVLALEGRLDGDIYREDYKKPLDILMEAVPKLKEASNEKTVFLRCERRLEIYLDLWEKIKDLIENWSIEFYDLEMAIPVFFDLDNEFKPSTLSAETVAEIEVAVSPTNLTPVILSAVGEDEKKFVIPTSIWTSTKYAKPIIDVKIAARLRRIFEGYAQKRTWKERGLISGSKIDTRRLYRTFTDGRCFVEKRIRHDIGWDICVLLDASQSMAKKWWLAESIVATLDRALKGTPHNLEAFAYFESDKVCMITRMLKGEKVTSVTPMGRTPSGQAIIAAAYLMSKKRRRKLMIHITDGESNIGCSVKSGINYALSKNIKLITLGVGVRDRKRLIEQYGDNIRFVESFDQLPSAIESLLRSVFR